MSDFGSKAKDFLDKTIKDNADKLKDGIEKAGDLVDKTTGGKYADKIDDLQGKADAFVNSRSADPTSPAPDTADAAEDAAASDAATDSDTAAGADTDGTTG